MKKVVIYTGSLCVHCDRAKALLNRKNINFIEYNVAEDSTKRDEMLKKSNGAKKIPQIFIGNYHVGGNLELETLERKGKLDELLEIKPSA
jgi:glutaredoxin 3